MTKERSEQAKLQNSDADARIAPLSSEQLEGVAGGVELSDISFKKVVDKSSPVLF
jgi:type VI protein secretion system component Hcp